MKLISTMRNNLSYELLMKIIAILIIITFPTTSTTSVIIHTFNSYGIEDILLSKIQLIGLAFALISSVSIMYLISGAAYKATKNILISAINILFLCEIIRFTVVLGVYAHTDIGLPLLIKGVLGLMFTSVWLLLEVMKEKGKCRYKHWGVLLYFSILLICALSVEFLL